ncbi:tetratricopeptide repeat protein [Agrobacterium pusense]|uniref:tetratricopeptide repeat protein n=1 Tax=Agrobacterium pusense TaxID=648995 RepID=UPI003FD1F354
MYDFNCLDRIVNDLIATGKAADAIKIYLFMADGDRSLDAGYVGERLGECYEKIGDLHAAKYWYGRAVEENPDFRLISVAARKRLQMSASKPFWAMEKSSLQRAAKAILSRELSPEDQPILPRQTSVVSAHRPAALLLLIGTQVKSTGRRPWDNVTWPCNRLRTSTNALFLCPARSTSFDDRRP